MSLKNDMILNPTIASYTCATSCSTPKVKASVTEFVKKITHIANTLAFAGKPVDDDDLVSIIMNNIGPAFKATVSSALARDTLISYVDLATLLLRAELRMKSHSSPALDATPTALYAPTQSVFLSQ